MFFGNMLSLYSIHLPYKEKQTVLWIQALGLSEPFNSRLHMLFRIGALKNFAIFTGVFL